MKAKPVATIILVVILIGTMAIQIMVKAYPFEDIFKEDLLEIAEGNPKIESINIESWSDHRPSAIWAVIQINYIAGLSDDERIAIQYDVQNQLEPKGYIDYVEPNYIFTIPENPPPPWPGFVIGELIVGFIIASEQDVAVTHVVAWPNLTLPSYVYVNVTVENNETSYETFNVTIHADNITVTSATVADLAPGSNKTLKLRCDLFPFREVVFPPPPWPLEEPMVVNVTIWAEASVAAGEIDISNNALVNGTISIIWWVLDLNGDGAIDIVDITLMAIAFEVPNPPPWLDLNGDGEIDILEITILARAFGQVYFEPADSDDP
ncbi:MAG TPA: dockerin type I domain-containing protein [Candidatus Bathyarchaeia archaeon]